MKNVRFLSAKSLLFILLFFCATVETSAQKFVSYDIEVKSEVKNEDGELVAVPAMIGQVLFFESKRQAIEVYEKFKGDDAGLYEPSPKEYSEAGEVDHGKLKFNTITKNKFCLAIDKDERLISTVYTVSPGETNFKLIMKSVIQTLASAQVNAAYTRKRRDGQSFSYGRTQKIVINSEINQQEASSKMRYALIPIVFVDTDTTVFTSAALDSMHVDSILRVCRPLVLDGAKYKETMYRRMGYDMNDKMQNVHDVLGRFVLPQSVYDRKHAFFKDTVYVENVNYNHRYMAMGVRSYENYRSIILRDTILVDKGFSTRPYRFLEFNMSQQTDIDKTVYERKPSSELQESNEPLNLKFARGKAFINPDDSVSFAELQKVQKKINDIIDGDGVVYGVELYGQASPDGGYAKNVQLARERAEYMGREVRSRVSISSGKVTTRSNVATWTDLANAILADSLEHPENMPIAQQVLDIVATTSNMDQQYARIRQLEAYGTVINEYLNKLTIAEAHISYKTERPWTREETIRKYNDDKSRYMVDAYKYGYLFDYLQEKPDELKEVAKRAMKEVPTTYNNKEVPWELAAYYYAKCIANEGGCDTTILKPYIHHKWLELDKDMYIGGKVNGKWLCRWNDRAIILTQVRMLANDGLYTRASYLLENYFENDPNLAQLRAMLRCMSGAQMDDETKAVVKGSSVWNQVVMLAAEAAEKEEDGMTKAMQQLSYEALTLLNDSTQFFRDNAREYYMMAILQKRLCGHNRHRSESTIPLAQPIFEFNTEYDKVPVPNVQKYGHSFNLNQFENERPQDYGYWMMKACEMDPSYLNVLRLDGEFIQPYRDGFAKVWNAKHPERHLR